MLATRIGFVARLWQSKGENIRVEENNITTLFNIYIFCIDRRDEHRSFEKAP